jgi:hypothetical protein
MTLKRGSAPPRVSGAPPPTSLQPGQRSSRPPLTPCDALCECLTLPHYKLRIDQTCRLVVIQRTSETYATLDSLTQCFDQLVAAIASVERAQYVLLIDTRQAPARNDPQFEAVFERQRARMLTGFSQCAVIVATAAGKLQVHRYVKQDGVPMFIANTTAAAFDALGLPFHAL